MGRVLGLDVGDRRIGVALSDPEQRLARGIKVISRTRLSRDLAAIARLVRENDVREIVVGLPLRLDGTPGAQAEKVQQFAQALARIVDVPIHFWDERLSTAEAERILRELGLRPQQRREHVDALAAELILQEFLDHRRRQRASRSESV